MTFDTWFVTYPLPAEIDTMDDTDRELWTGALRAAYMAGAKEEKHMSIEAMKRALEALDANRRTHYYCEDTWYSCPQHEDGCANDSVGDECNCGADKVNAEIDKAITAIRKVLAQPEQEPVAWRYNGKLHEFDPSDWATSPVTPLYTSPPSKPWVNPSLKEYEDIMLANITPRTEDERDGIMCALNDMVVLLKEKNQ